MPPTAPRLPKRASARSKRASTVHAHPLAEPIDASYYADPLVYDVLHIKGTAGEVNALERLAKRFAPRALKPNAAWLEPACGSARHLRILANRGKRVVGFDSDQGMVNFANAQLANTRLARKSPRATPPIFRARFDNFLTRRPAIKADIAFNLINTIRHVRSDAELLRHFNQIARALRPGGVYIVGLSLSLYNAEPPTEDVWSGSKGRLSVTQVAQYLPPTGPSAGRTAKGRDEVVISNLAVREGTHTRDINSKFILRTYSLDQWTRVLDRSPLRAIATADQDGHAIQTQSLGYQLFVLAPRKAPSIAPRRGSRH